jgi:hypothetical protein
MQTTSPTPRTNVFLARPRVVETARGTCHPHAPAVAANATGRRPASAARLVRR